jgi:hypothetical protein
MEPLPSHARPVARNRIADVPGLASIRFYPM